MPPRLPLRGRVVLVTGAARRLGAAIALDLAQAGADVAIHVGSRVREGVALARRIVRLRRRAIVIEADLSDPAAARATVATAIAALGRLDVLVNNAAIFEATAATSGDADAFDRHLAVNARAPYVLTAAAGAWWARTRREGCVVNLACPSAASPWAGFLPYSASKAALVALTKGFAKALAPRVRVNAVAPGPVLRAAGSTRARDRAAIDATVLRRWGSPADVAKAVRFLVIDAPYVTGAVIPVDGGRHLRG